MKKSLIALAVLGSVAGFAQAQSSVTVYGIVDLALVKDKDASATMEAGLLSGNRLGFKGVEDLGGGLKANFLMEHGFNADTGEQGAAGKSFNRQAYVGLSGGFGEFKLGNVYSAYDDISGATNAVFDSGLSVENGVWLSTGYIARPGNNLYYATPSMGGVSGALSTSLKEGGDDKSSAFNVKYEGGPVYVGAAYQVDTTAGGDTKFTRVNGSYDLGAAKILAGFGNVKSPAGLKTTDLSIGADVPLSASVVLSAGYASSKTDGAARASGFAVGAAYSLSKRTTVYGGLRTVNQDAVDLRGVAKTRVAAGLKHAF